ncbi:MAG: type II secretion system protein N [Pseudomonadota bacterium]|nr:type II secretion system protein N [Pseudomonadota bacterium]
MKRLRRHAKDEASSLRPPWAWALTGALLGMAIVFTLTAPARWLASGLARASSGMLLLTDAQGSLWNGSAQLQLTGGAGSQDRTALPGRLQWRLHPGLGHLSVAITSSCCTPNGPVSLRLSPRWGGAHASLSDSHTVWPAAVLSGLGTPWNTIQPQGELSLRTQNLHITWASGRASVSGRADITARNMSSRLSTLRPMGSYQAHITGGDAVALNLSTLEGGLRLSGSGQWVGGRLRFSGEATAAPGLEGQLANLLNIIGRRQGDRAIISLG